MVFKKIEELPLMLSVEDLQTVFNISRSVAYELVNSPNFPTLKINRRILIPKSNFIEWIEENINLNK